LLKHALAISQQAQSGFEWSTSVTLRNFMYVYHSQGDHQRALEYSFKAIEAFNKCAKNHIQDC
jgi:hypothetical protein